MDTILAEDKRAERLRLWAAGLSIAAGLVHLAVTPEHASEWWGYGLFFFLAAVAQGFYGLLLLLQPWRWDEAGGIRTDEGAERDTRLMYLLGVAGTAGIIGLYAVTRTVGIPFFGPEAGEVEPVTPISLISKLIEPALIGCLVALIRRARAGAQSRSQVGEG